MFLAISLLERSFFGKIFRDKQTNKQTNKQTDKQTNKKFLVFSEKTYKSEFFSKELPVHLVGYILLFS